jgi:predicted dehydrogenase
VHAQITHAAFERGLHVLCEKPLATSTADAESMLDHARQAKRVLFPGHNYKHAPVVRTVRQILESQRIGEVRLVTLDTFRTTHARGVREWNADWRRFRHYSGGGIAMDHGSHTFYLAFEWLRSYPTAITAHMQTLGSHLGDYDTEDNFSCTLTFPTGIATAKLTWNAGFRKVIYTLHGERGAIKIEDDDIELTAQMNGRPVVERQAIASHWMDAGHSGWFRSLLGDFQQAIRSDLFVGDDARESLLCVQAIETAYSSARNQSRELSLAPHPALVAIA